MPLKLRIFTRCPFCHVGNRRDPPCGMERIIPGALQRIQLQRESTTVGDFVFTVLADKGAGVSETS